MISILSAFLLDIIHARAIDCFAQFDLISFIVPGILMLFLMAALIVIFVLSFWVILSKHLKKSKLSTEKGNCIVVGCSAIISVITAVAVAIAYGELLFSLTIPICIGIVLLNIKTNSTVNEMFTINNVY